MLRKKVKSQQIGLFWQPLGHTFFLASPPTIPLHFTPTSFPHFESPPSTSVLVFPPFCFFFFFLLFCSFFSFFASFFLASSWRCSTPKILHKDAAVISENFSSQIESFPLFFFLSVSPSFFFNILRLLARGWLTSLVWLCLFVLVLLFHTLL